MRSPGNPKDTSWGKVADWYEEHLQGDDTYHGKVIAPNITRMLGAQKGMQILDLACGEGYFTRLIAQSGAEVSGADIARELVRKAQKASPAIHYYTAAAEKLDFAKDDSFDAITCVLALQNIEGFGAVFKECARVLKPGGRLLFVLNHPAFRIPKKTSWGWDDKEKIQYRRVDAYLSAGRARMDMAPGKEGGGPYTWSFHRSLQDHMKALSAGGFALTRLEEWISHKKSETGPRAEAEDRARKEFPFFLAAEATLLKKG